MYSLRSLFSITLVAAIIMGLWVLGDPDSPPLDDRQKTFTAVLVTVMCITGFACLLSWIRGGEEVNKTNRRWVALTIDSIAFLATCALMFAACRLGANVLFK